MVDMLNVLANLLGVQPEADWSAGGGGGVPPPPNPTWSFGGGGDSGPIGSGWAGRGGGDSGAVGSGWTSGFDRDIALPGWTSLGREPMGAAVDEQRAIAQKSKANQARYAMAQDRRAQEQGLLNPANIAGAGAAGPAGAAMRLVQYASGLFGEKAGPVVAALLDVEKGLGGGVGDLTGPGATPIGSHGPFQFHPGGQLAEYAKALGVSLEQAGEFARQNPLHAGQWALNPSGYLGRQLQTGIAAGLEGDALLRHVLRTQNPGAVGTSYETSYQDALRRAPTLMQNWAQTVASSAANSAPGAQPLLGGAPSSLQNMARGVAGQVLAKADEWVQSAPVYRAVGGATTRQVADCSGFIIGVFNELGMPFRGGVRTAEQIRAASVPVDTPQPGDLVFFQNTYPIQEGSAVRDGRVATHVGIVTENGIMLDTGGPEGTRSLGRHSYNTPFWQQRLIEYRRPPQLAGP